MDCGKLIIFDWDDTILPTSFLLSNGYHPSNLVSLKDEHRIQLEELEKVSINLINLAKKCGKVCIVTNSQKGWVEITSAKFVPRLRNHLKDVEVISARTSHEDRHPNKPMMWKLLSMAECITKHFKNPDVVTDFISFGDSPDEREASRLISKGLSSSTLKSVKFCRSPNIIQLHKQLEVIHNNFPFICTHKDNLDLMLNITVNA